MIVSFAGVFVLVLCIPLAVLVFLTQSSIKKMSTGVDKLEQKTLETMDHVLATSVPLQLAREINSCALEEAVLLSAAAR